MEYIHLIPNEAPPKILTQAPFKVIVMAQESVDPKWQAAISDWMVESGCFYMMAWGVECSSWDDSVDWASIHANDYQETSDEKFVITTWHDDETLEEVLWYAKFTASHPVHELKNLVVIYIANEAHDDLCRLYEAIEF